MTSFPRESTLSQEEVQQLTSDLGVDCIIAMENLQFKATKTVRYIRDFNCYLGTVDVKAYPTVKGIPALAQQTDDYATPHRQYLLGRIRRIGNRNICTHDT